MLALADGVAYFIANLEQPKAQGNRQGFLYAVDLATAQALWKHRVNREKPYVDEWPTTYFAADSNSVYYENSGFLAKVGYQAGRHQTRSVRVSRRTVLSFRGSAWDQRRGVAQHADEPRPLASAQTPTASAANVRIE